MISHNTWLKRINAPMEWQKSFSLKPTTSILFISMSISFPLLISFWAFGTGFSSPSQTQLLSKGLEVTKADAFPAPSANLSVPEPKYPISSEIHEVGPAYTHGEALDSPGSSQNGISSDAFLINSTISSNEEKDLVGQKNALTTTEVSTRGGIFSAPTTEALIPTSSSLISNGSSTTEVSTHGGIFSAPTTEALIPTSSSLISNRSSTTEVSTHGGIFSAPTTEALIPTSSSLISNESSDNTHKKSPTSVLAKLGAKDCDVSYGKWVYDESYPLYESNACPYIDEGFSCEVNGRIDREYMKWRWQPNNCNIPKFNPAKFLELIRGKRIVFVGDSLNRNQWESMMCLLRGGISDPSRVHEARGRKITKERGVYNFKFTDYHCSVEYYVTHFLVHGSKAKVGQKRVQTLQIDRIDRSSSRWKGADILVFNTAHWWSHYKTKAGVNYYQEEGKVLPRLNVSNAFSKALTTWATWVDRNVNAKKTRVFFRSSAPSHFSGGEWSSGGHCRESTQPLNHAATPNTPEMNLIVDQIVSQMRTPVTVLNITSLSGLRIDGHPSVYGRRPGIRPPSGGEDCSHWCLPGVPDTWNELLYFYLEQKLTAE